MRSPLTPWYWARHRRLNGMPSVEGPLAAFAALDGEGRRRALGLRLQAQLRHFADLPGAFPEWQELAREADPLAVLEAWPRLPIQTKADLRTRFTPEAVQARLGGRGIPNATGGSTGEPTHFVHDPDMVRLGLALQTRSWQAMGWRPGLPLLSLWGSQRDIGAQLKGLPALKRRLSNHLYGFEVVDGFAITEAKAHRTLDWMERHGPLAIYGYTSLLDFLARVALDSGRTLSPGRVLTAWNGGECLFPDQSERFRSAFGVPILNYYAGRELGTLACQTRDGGPLEIPRPLVHLELVDAEGRPAAPGTPGRILVTSTLAQGTPFLRYEVGDLGTARPELEDAAGLAALATVEGRLSSLLTIGGQTVSNIYWNHLFKEYEEVRQFQVQADRSGGLTLRFMGPGFSPEREAGLREILHQFLGSIPLTILWVDQIPLTRNGKLIQVVQEGA